MGQVLRSDSDSRIYDLRNGIAHLVHLDLTAKGSLLGRVLTESLRGHETDPLSKIEYGTSQSDPAFNGWKTILHTQAVGEYIYYDAAGFPGRTVGLESVSR